MVINLAMFLGTKWHNNNELAGTRSSDNKALEEGKKQGEIQKEITIK